MRETASFVGDDARIWIIGQAFDDGAANEASFSPDDQPFDDVQTCPIR
jgi:hypothetical protein